MKKEVLAFAACAALALAPGLRAADTATGASKAASNQAESKADPAMVLSKLHLANQSEIAMGKLAQQKGQTAAVKQYGQKLEQDHQQADDKVQQVASSQSLSLKQPADDKDLQKKQDDAAKMHEKLSKLSGAKFDHEFAEAMVDDHKHDIKELRKAESSLAPGPVRDLVAQVLPTLESHLTTAQTLVKGSKSKS